MKSALKDFLALLGIKGRVRNHSSVPLWIIESSTNHPHGPPVVHCLKPGMKSPAGIDSDGFRRVDEKPIQGHPQWWKITDVSTADIFDDNSDLSVFVIYKTSVDEHHFGEPEYRDCDQPWGEPISYILGLKKDKKGKTIAYMVDSIGWLSKSETIELLKKGGIDNAVLVSRKDGIEYLRSYPGQPNFKELDS